MKKIMIACAAALAVFAACAQDVAPIEREKPQLTPNELLPELLVSGSATWRSGFAQGQAVATSKLLALLYQYRLTNIPVCFGNGLSNATLVSTIRDQMAAVVMPQFPNAVNTDNWDTAGIELMAIATIQRFPCR